MKLWNVLFTLALFACASPAKHVTDDPVQAASLFPNGTYVHQVKLDVPTQPDPAKRNFEFRGAVQITREIIRIVVLSPIGTTLFKMSEDRATGKVSVENFIPSLKPYEGKLPEYYACLRVLLTTPRHPSGPGFWLDPQGRPTGLKTEVEGQPTRFSFADYDEHEIPTTLRIESSTFNVDVKVLGYDL